jgi:hypothetical protein
MSKTLILQGSDRRDGDTQRLVSLAFEPSHVTEIYLLDHTVDYYRYERAEHSDDFLAIAEAMSRADVIVFATPVYWYAMSGRMKVLFDRLTDLLSLNKALGRGLKGRRTCLLACGVDAALPEGFEVPFKRTSDYFEMRYLGALYAQASPDGGLLSNPSERALSFGRRVCEDGSGK